MTTEQTTVSLLKAVALRATPGRISLFEYLKKAKSPHTVEELHAEVPNVDLVTIYRTLQIFRDKELVREVYFNDGVVRYELAEQVHHHHLVCTQCGRVDELFHCDVSTLENKILLNSSFVSINHHTLEFFGSCKSCAKTV